MSLEVRQRLQESLIFQNPEAQRYQLTEMINGASYAIDTNLILALDLMIRKSMLFVITALRDDHSIDGCLGPDNHNPGGRAVDFWFLKSSSPVDYLEPDSEQFVTWVGMLRSLPNITGVGLGGSADIGPNREAAGSFGFSDNDSDHLHIQVS
jgi:hypothetical protein